MLVDANTAKLIGFSNARPQSFSDVDRKGFIQLARNLLTPVHPFVRESEEAECFRDLVDQWSLDPHRHCRAQLRHLGRLATVALPPAPLGPPDPSQSMMVTTSSTAALLRTAMINAPLRALDTATPMDIDKPESKSAVAQRSADAFRQPALPATPHVLPDHKSEIYRSSFSPSLSRKATGTPLSLASVNIATSVKKSPTNPSPVAPSSSRKAMATPASLSAAGKIHPLQSSTTDTIRSSNQSVSVSARSQAFAKHHTFSQEQLSLAPSSPFSAGLPQLPSLPLESPLASVPLVTPFGVDIQASAARADPFPNHSKLLVSEGAWIEDSPARSVFERDYAAAVFSQEAASSSRFMRRRAKTAPIIVSQDFADIDWSAKPSLMPKRRTTGQTVIEVLDKDPGFVLPALALFFACYFLLGLTVSQIVFLILAGCAMYVQRRRIAGDSQSVFMSGFAVFAELMTPRNIAALVIVVLAVILVRRLDSLLSSNTPPGLFPPPPSLPEPMIPASNHYYAPQPSVSAPSSKPHSSSLYQGELIGGVRHGMGMEFNNDRRIYEGEWARGVRAGRGRSYFETGDLQYDGEWREGLFHGKGKLYANRGLVYEGEFERGLRSGNGRAIYPKQVTFTGRWSDGVRHGEGRLVDSMRGETIKGTWVHDVLEGKGELWRSDGSRFEGHWVKGRKDGFGVIHYPVERCSPSRQSWMFCTSTADLYLESENALSKMKAHEVNWSAYRMHPCSVSCCCGCRR